MTSSSKQTQTRTGWALIATALLLAGGFAAESGAATTSQKAAATYTWSAEVVSFDKSSRMLTLKSRIEEASEVKGLDHLMKNNPITLTWTGFTWGAGVRDVTRGHESSAPADTLILPAEFVSTELDNRYIVYRLPVPAASVSNIEKVMPGQWVTAMSPRHSSDPRKAILDIHPYNEAS